MALIATPGGALSNSFATVAQALLAQIGRPGAAAWAAAEPDVQEASLIQATLLLSLKVLWLDVMVDPLVQALPFPMVGQVDQYGRLLAVDVIPPLIVTATAWYALALFLEHSQTTGASQGIASLRVDGDVTITYREGSGVSVVDRLPSDLWALLRFYGRVPMVGRSLPVYRG